MKKVIIFKKNEMAASRNFSFFRRGSARQVKNYKVRKSSGEQIPRASGKLHDVTAETYSFFLRRKQRKQNTNPHAPITKKIGAFVLYYYILVICSSGSAGVFCANGMSLLPAF